LLDSALVGRERMWWLSESAAGGRRLAEGAGLRLEGKPTLAERSCRSLVGWSSSLARDSSAAVRARIVSATPGAAAVGCEMRLRSRLRAGGVGWLLCPLPSTFDMSPLRPLRSLGFAAAAAGVEAAVERTVEGSATESLLPTDGLERR
jgi:hypothetical protein